MIGLFQSPILQNIQERLWRMTPVAFYPIIRTLTIEALRIGPIPQHVSFIMDGNRRYSRKHGLTLQEGHLHGFESLKTTLEFLFRLGVSNVTVYAFAIDNYKRTTQEVEYLMNMGKSKMQEICDRDELFERFGIRVHIIGRIDLLPVDVQNMVAKVEASTAHNTQGVINIAFCYSSQDEISSAIAQTVEDTICDKLDPDAIDVDMLASNLYTAHTPPLDMLVRTSGVNRISDFLLWQLITNSTKYFINHDGQKCRDTIEGATYHIVPTYWPDFGMEDMVPILLEWQLAKFLNGLGLTTEAQDGNLLC